MGSVRFRGVERRDVETRLSGARLADVTVRQHLAMSSLARTSCSSGKGVQTWLAGRPANYGRVAGEPESPALCLDGPRSVRHRDWPAGPKSGNCFRPRRPRSIGRLRRSVPFILLRTKWHHHPRRRVEGSPR